MSFFSRQPNKSPGQILEAEKSPKAETISLEVHTMPKKFLGLKPKLPVDHKPETGDTFADHSASPRVSLKKNIIISLVVVALVGAIMAAAAYFFINREAEAPADNGVIPVPPTTPPVQPAPPQPQPQPPIPPPTTEPQPPLVNPPSDLALVNVGPDSGRLQWLDNSGNEQGFRIYRSLQSDFQAAEIITNLGPDISSFTQVNLNCGTLYYFWVEAFLDADSGLAGPLAVTTTDCAPVPVPPSSQASDEDQDLLSESEELLYGTQVSQADSDLDSYPDGQEVLNLFNPRFAQGAKLSDSSAVRTFISDEYGYRLLVPVSWQENLVGDQANQVRFTASPEEFVEIIVEDNPTLTSTAREWYLQQFPGIKPSDLGDVRGENISGISSPDGLTSYFVSGNKIFVITYNPALSQTLNFLTTYRMMIRSFSLFDNPFNQS